MRCKSCLKNFLRSKTLWLAILVPVLCSPLPVLQPNSVGKCGYCLLVIGLYWVTEVIPLAVTSLLPVVLFPVFGIMTAKDVCSAYVKDTLMLFLGSLIVAVAVEKWNLHKRLALRTLTLVGPQPKWLLLGVMLPTWFLSMWMSNTATTAMMVPIVSAILQQIKECQQDDDDETSMLKNDHSMTVTVDVDDATNVKPREELTIEGESTAAPRHIDKERQILGFAKTFSLATAFSANIGGIATLTGTPPNVIFKGLADKLYKKNHGINPINFANWLAVGMPLAIILFVFNWIWMQLYFQGPKCLLFWKKDPMSYEKIRQSLRQEYMKLGGMTFAEVIVTINFIILAVLWVTRKPGFMPGWGDLFITGYVGDSSPAILIAVLLFIQPARPPSWLGCFRSKKVAISEVIESRPPYEPILDWETVNRRMSWGVLLLMGGGFAVAEGCEVSGLSGWVSDNLASMSFLPTWVIAIVLSCMISAATEVTSNAATTTLFVPIAGDLAVRLGVNPLYFMIPCTISTSLAFLLPVATPPNAIVFATGVLRVKDMFLAGLPINLFALLLLNVALNSWMIPIYDLDHIPDGFPRPNLTNAMTIEGLSGVPYIVKATTVGL